MPDMLISVKLLNVTYGVTVVLKLIPRIWAIIQQHLTLKTPGKQEQGFLC